jgi:predicted amidohydrolase YtcJ
MERLRHLCLAVQPIHFCADATWAEVRLGRERLPTSHRWRSLMERGAVVGFGSDFPIESGDPMAAIRALVGETPSPVREWDRSTEHLDRYAAFEGYWGRAAYLAFDEVRLGRLAPGFLADFVCLSGDPFGEESLSDVRVVATYVGGKCVFEDAKTQG